MNSGIYKITNLINNKVYIGKSIDIAERWRFHQYPGHWKNSSKILYQAFQKYGLENFIFEIIEYINPKNKDEMNKREIFWINYYNSYKNGYNQTIGGDGDISDSRIIKEEDIKNIRIRKMNYASPTDVFNDYKNTMTYSTFNKIWIGKYYTDIMGDIYQDEDKIKYIEKVLKQRMTLAKNNMEIDWIIDIKRRRANGEQRKDVMTLYPQIKTGTFDGIWYNKYYKEITEDNKDYINIIKHEIMRDSV